MKIVTVKKHMKMNFAQRVVSILTIALKVDQNVVELSTKRTQTGMTWSLR